MSRTRLATTLFSLLLLLAATPADGQQGAQQGGQGSEPPSTTADAPAPPTYPPRAELASRYISLVDDAASARRRIADLSQVDRLLADAEEAQRLGERLDRQLGERLDQASSVSSALLFDLRQAIESFHQQVVTLGERVGGRLAELDDLRADWRGRQETWTGWRDDLAERGELSGFSEDFSRGLELIEGVLGDAGRPVSDMGELQQQVQGLQDQAAELQARLDGAVAAQRAELRQRDAPFFLSAEHRAQLDAATWRSAGERLRGLGAGSRGFLAGNFGLLLLLFAVAVAVTLIGRHFRRRYGDDEEWRVLLSRPWVIGLFVTMAVAPLLPWLPPPLWLLLMVAGLAAGTCLLAPGIFQRRRERGLVYALTFLYVTLSALEVIAPPAGPARLAVAGAAFAGALTLFVAGRAEVRSPAKRGWAVVLFDAAAVAFALILVAQLLGYDALSRWLLDALLTTAFIAFVCLFLLRLGSGAIRAALRRPQRGGLVTVREVAHELAPRLVRAFQVLLVAVAALYVLAIWGIFDSPAEAWSRIVGTGVTVGSHRITVNHLLLGLFAVYAATVTSSVVRGLFDRELTARQLAPGVADSIKTLLHYALILVGLAIALGLLGFDLSTFAIIAGALGVGIGFGLQNIVNNFLSGLILLFERPIRVGDVIMIGSDWSTVQRIGLRSTVVRTFDSAELIVPNSDLISQQVTNWSLTDQKTRMKLDVGVAYGSDLETVFRILQEVPEANAKVANEPPPNVHFMAFGDSSLNFEIRLWVNEIADRFDVRSEVLTEVDRRFREAGVEVPFPQRDVHMR